MGQTQAVSSGIPFDSLYDDFLEMDCAQSMIPSSYKTRQIDLKPLCDEELFELVQIDVEANANVFYRIIYSKRFYGSMYHVAGVLKRGATFEYVDSMASTHVANSAAQRVFELTFGQICKRLDCLFFDSFSMYGMNPHENDYGEIGSYKQEPPQSAELVFVGNLKMFDSNLPVIRYAKSLTNYEGADCMFWAHFVARDLIEKNVSAKQWMGDFANSNYARPIPGLAPGHSLQRYKAGYHTVRFITNAIMNELARCARCQMTSP